MIFEAMTLNDAKKLYDKIRSSNIVPSMKNLLLNDIVYFTEKFEIDYGYPPKKVKYYVEIVDCEDRSSYVIQSKWFDELEQAREWFNNDVDFIHDDFEAYIMYAEWDETSDSYGDIEQLEQLFKRNTL